MLNRRYAEDGDIPTLTYSTDDLTQADIIKNGRRAQYIVLSTDKAPTSSTSEAVDCFVYRGYSKTLQQALINYAYTLVTSVAMSGEV